MFFSLFLGCKQVSLAQFSIKTNTKQVCWCRKEKTDAESLYVLKIETTAQQKLTRLAKFDKFHPN